MLKISYAIIGICVVIGVIFGPVSWIASANFFGEYADFEKGATVITGDVVAKRTKKGFRSGIDYVDIQFIHHLTVYRRVIEVERPLWNHVSVTQEVELFYNPKKPDLIKLTMENEAQFVPPILKRGLGMWITITSYGLLISLIVYRRRKDKRGVAR